MPTTNAESWVPFQWPKAWNTGQQLTLLEGTPVTCVLNAPAAVATAAKARGLMALSKDEAARSVAFLAEPVWPSVKMARRGDQADSGPTGAPWVDANGWSIQLARALAPGKPVWVDAAPPAEAVLDDRNYLLAVVEPATYGGRWAVAIDDGFAGKLSAGDGSAKQRWVKMMDTVRFFDAHRAWAGQEVRSNLAVISDFAGPNEFIAREFLNLAARRNLSYRIWLRASAATADTAAVKAILYVDEQAPDAALERKLDGFVRAGGLLIARKAPPFTKWTGAAANSPVPGYASMSIGKGRLAMPSKAWEDPWVMSQEVRTLAGHRTDTIRLYNAGIMGAYYTRSREGDRGVLHLVNYTRRPAVAPVSVALADTYSSARAVSPEGADPKPVRIEPRRETFAEMALPAFSVYTAVELAR